VRRRLLIVFLLAGLLVPASAFGDADPASDVLLGVSVFYPYQPAVPAALQKQLNAEAATAAKAHFPVKVAIIGSPVDLGALPTMFGKPQQYATFLDQEISFNGPQKLLVVMPQGYGSSGLPPAAAAAVKGLPPPSAHTNQALVQAALAAVPKLTAAAGHPIAKDAAGSPAASGGSSPALLVAILAVVAVGATAGVILLRRRAAAR
jgi:hypothetical protein